MKTFKNIGTYLRFLIAMACFYLFETPLHAQVFYVQDAMVHINDGAVVHCNGGFSVSATSNVINNGTLTTTVQSNLSHPGDMHIHSGAIVSGNGIYRIEQDWINDGFFIADNSTVELFGNNQQFILSTTATPTQFNHLILLGNGNGMHRRKTLVNVNASTSQSGILQLNDRELHTSDYIFKVENPDVNAILHANSFNQEGFVSSVSPFGFLTRQMNLHADYLFPVGSSDGIRRYRPVEINPNTNEKQSYSVRMNNVSADNDSFFLLQRQDDIEDINALFYHSIRPEYSTTNPNIAVYYISSDDGKWTGLGHWSPTQTRWNDIQKSTTKTATNFEVMQSYNWNFIDNSEHYALIKSIRNLGLSIYIPNSFTPEGNDVNDVFLPTLGSGVDITDYQMQIFDRWGELIFETNDSASPWNGFAKNGQMVQTGTYVWTIRVRMNDSAKREVIHGHVNLLR